MWYIIQLHFEKPFIKQPAKYLSMFYFICIIFFPDKLYQDPLLYITIRSKKLYYSHILIGSIMSVWDWEHIIHVLVTFLCVLGEKIKKYNKINTYFICIYRRWRKKNKGNWVLRVYAINEVFHIWTQITYSFLYIKVWLTR